MRGHDLCDDTMNILSLFRVNAWVIVCGVIGKKRKNGQKVSKVCACSPPCGGGAESWSRSWIKLSEEMRWRIVLRWKDEKKGTQAIAKELGISRSKVQDLIQKYQESGTIHDRPRPGRKRKLSDAEIKKAAKQAKSGKSAPVIARSFSKSTPQNSKTRAKTISDRTVQRRLKEAGLKYLVVQEQDQPTPAQIQKRLAYARARKHFDRKPVLFTDEK